MTRLLIAAVLVLAAAAPAVAGEITVIGTRAMNHRMDRITPGVTPVGALAPNRATEPVCTTITGNFRYPDGTIRSESKVRCE